LPLTSARCLNSLRSRALPALSRQRSSSMPERILIIDDDRKLAEMLVEYLSSRGYAPFVRGNATDGLAAVRDGLADAVILDVMLPDGDGLDVCKRLRANSEIPVLMLTARGEPTDRIVGLELGADDYLPKPFDPRELVARLRAILRRRAPRGDEMLRFGRLEIDADAREVRVDGTPRGLTSYQFDLLWALARSAGRALSREALMERVKGENLEAFDRSIDVHVSRIRAAIEDDPKHPKRILTLRGVGYLFARLQDDERPA
jgi:two-component system phosphate regulon response regulator OmpR